MILPELKLISLDFDYPGLSKYRLFNYHGLHKLFSPGLYIRMGEIKLKLYFAENIAVEIKHDGFRLSGFIEIQMI